VRQARAKRGFGTCTQPKDLLHRYYTSISTDYSYFTAYNTARHAPVRALLYRIAQSDLAGMSNLKEESALGEDVQTISPLPPGPDP
jgi:hypothetical protein